MSNASSPIAFTDEIYAKITAGNPTPTSIRTHDTYDIGETLFWFFSYAEAAQLRLKLLRLPRHVAMHLTGELATPRAINERARELIGSISDILDNLEDRHTNVLRTAFTPGIWPRALFQRFGILTPIVVRLAMGAIPWPESANGNTHEQNVAFDLANGWPRTRLPPPGSSSNPVGSWSRRCSGS